MRIQSILIALILFAAACKSPEKKAIVVSHDTVATVKDTTKFSAPLVKSLYSNSDLVAKIKVISTVKKQEIYIITAQMLEAYKGQAAKLSEIKYEAFLEEGDYKEFVDKTLIIFLKTNTQDKQLYSQGVHWGRTEPNVEFAYSDSLKNHILNIK
ncbi:hypothetical protein ACVW0P_000597 [Mucilaginibacter sp. UYNi724]